MSRKIFIYKKNLKNYSKTTNLLYLLFINKILKKGKKLLAKRLFFTLLDYIQLKTNQNPRIILEKAIRNISPLFLIKKKKINNVIFHFPTFLTKLESIKISIVWLLHFAKNRSEKTFNLRLFYEIIDASKGIGSCIKKKQEIYKLAESVKYNIEI